MHSELETHVYALLEEKLKERGYDLVSVAYECKKGGNELQVVVDRVEPISLEDIVEVSDLVSKTLDEDDPIEEAYNLDVSSLGAEKPIVLDKLGCYVGRYVNLVLSSEINGYDEIEGDLEKVEGEKILISYKEKTRLKKAEIPLGNIARARLAIKF